MDYTSSFLRLTGTDYITSDQKENVSSNTGTGSMFIGLMLSAIMLGSIIGNILVITVIRREVTLHTPANFLICSLAVTDLLVAFLVMPFSAVYEILGAWVLGEAFCQVWSATDIACCTASILHLCAIALERHQSVTNAVRYFTLSNRRTVAPKIITVWLLAICISIPPVLGWRSRSVPEKANNWTSTVIVTKYCQAGHEPGYTVFATMSSFYIPLMLLFFLYGRIYRNIHSYVKRSESRSLLSSVYSEDCSLAPKRRSSLLSLLHRSQSRASVQSRLSRTRNSIRKSDAKTRNFASGSPGTVILEADDANEGNTINQQKTTDKSEEIKTISPKEYRRKIHSHPSASSPNAKVRYKRSTFLRRQMAIDNGLESHSAEPNQILSEKTNEEGCERSERRRKAKGVGEKRRYSDGDIQRFQSSSECIFKTSHRPRTNTAGARVHFMDEVTTKFIKKESSFCSMAKQTDVGCSPKHQRKKFLEISRTRKPNFMNSHPKRYFSCLSCASRPNYSFQHQFSVREDLNPFARYSFSLRSKIKALKAREIRAIKTLGTIVGAFVLCWLPFFTVTISKPFCSCEIPRVMDGIVLWLGYCNSLINPIIYAACNRDFHAAFQKLLDTSSRVSGMCKCLVRRQSFV